MMLKSVLCAVAMACATPAFAGGLDLAPIRGDLDRAMASNGNVVWLIYGAVSREKVAEAVKELAPIKNRMAVGVYDFGVPGLTEDVRSAFKAAGFRVCEKWGRDEKLIGVHKPKAGDMDFTNSALWQARSLHDAHDALIFEGGSRQLEAVGGEWEMGGTLPGGAKKNYVFVNLLSEDLDGEEGPKPERVTDDAKVGGLAHMTDMEGGRGCFVK